MKRVPHTTGSRLKTQGFPGSRLLLSYVMDEQEIKLSPSQGIKLLSLCAMLKDGDISFRGHEQEDEDNATAAMRDIGQEIALQIVGY